MKGFLSIVILALIFSITSCRNSERDLDTSTGSSESAWNGMNHFHTVMREVHRVAQVDSVLNGIAPSDALSPAICFDSLTRLPDSGPFPIDLSIFYNSDVECPDVRNRGGIIHASFDGLYSEVGTQINISFTDYQADDFLISGNINMEVVFSGIDTLEFKVTITDGKIIDTYKPGNNVSYFSADLTYMNDEGRKTIPTSDDNFRIQGTGNGMAENGVIYSYIIENDMVLLVPCELERFGSFRLSAPNTSDRICNVNEGEDCNKKMLVTIEPSNGSQLVEIK